MNVRHFNAMQDAFLSLVEMEPAERAIALQRLRASNAELAKEVEELLEEDAASQQVPEPNLRNMLQEVPIEQQASSIPEQIGPYRLIRLLGEGGMGVVYLAERADIAGQFAIKLLRDAWVSPMRRRRFHMEQHMLGLLNHPAIARIYDAGTTPSGTPWFVMEFADGVAISEYIRAHATTLREKMKLFCAICEAVQYAHSHAIIHRDLKPSNVLVADDGQIKLLDFGIAKQLETISEGSTATTAGLRLFTPAYSAPELQSANDVGVFTDIYSLGVILYEMVTGTLPYPAGWTAEREPRNPYVAIQRVGSSSDRESVKSEYADVDAICSKALEQDPARRYGSADALKQDVQAYLEDRPLSARKGAFLYIARKFTSRNRALLGSLLFALVSLVVATIFFTVRLARARDLALAEAARSDRIQRFTESLFTGGQQTGVPPPNIKITQMLDRGRVEASSLTTDSQLQSDLFRVLGSAYFSLQRYQAAEPILRRAEQVSCASETKLPCAKAKVALARVLTDEGVPKPEDERLLKEALHIQQELLPGNDPVIANTWLQLGWAYAQRGQRSEATEYLTRALDLASSAGHPTPMLADALAAYGEYVVPYNDPRAVEYEQRSAQMYKQLFGKDSFEYASSQQTLGVIQMNLGQYDKAESSMRLALAAVRAWSGVNDAATIHYIEILGLMLSLEGKFAEARTLLLKDVAILSHSGNAPDVSTCTAYYYLGFIDLQQGRLRAAESRFNAVLSLARSSVALSDATVQVNELGLADIYAKRGEYKRSEEMSRQALASGREEGDFGQAASHAILGHALLKERRLAEAESELQIAYRWFSHDPTMRPHTLETYQDLAETESRLGKPQEASRIRRELRAHPNLQATKQ